MKRLSLLLATVLLIVCATAQNQSSGHPSVWLGDVNPGRCVPGDLYVQTTSVRVCNETGRGSMQFYTSDSGVPASAMPAFTGDMTTAAGSTATTVGKINNGTFAGAQGNLVSFGASNVPGDSGIKLSSLPMVVSGTLASSDLLSLGTTAVLAVPAQGANTVILVDRFVANMIVGTPYTGTANACLCYGQSYSNLLTALGSGASIIGNAVINGASNYYVTSNAPSPTNQPSSGFVNTALYFKANATISTGTGTLNWTIYYHVITGVQ